MWIYILNFYFCKTQIGDISVVEDKDFITNIFFGRRAFPKNFIEKKSEVIKLFSNEIEKYFSGELKSFSVQINYIGSDFMKKVWYEVLKVPYGETVSYKDISIRIAKPNAYRAVGLANNRNQIPIIIPCHRVIGSKGDLVGYAGGIHIKKQLIELEKRYR